MQKPAKQRNIARFIGLGALSATAFGASNMTLRSVAEIHTPTPVDALRQGPPIGTQWPFVSIIVPARNEARNLPRLIPSLLAQQYPSYEVIVVDDQSEDDSPRILAEFAELDPRLKVVRGAELPREEGWLGKPHAMHQGAQHATGDWLLFTDADTEHAPLSLATTISYAMQHKVDLLTIFPHYELETPSERLIMPVAFEGIFSLYPPEKVLDPKSKVAIANGQYILIRREVYDAVGGAESVKHQIAEDLEFAKVVKGAGYKLDLINGRHLMRVRMYTNFREIWEGWSKNIVLSFRDNPAQGVLSVLGVNALVVAPLLLLRWVVRSFRAAAVSGKPDDLIAASWVSGLAAYTLGSQFYYRRTVDRMLGLPPGWTLTQPLGALVLGLIMVVSAIRLATGQGVVWKGRTYAVRD